MKELKQSMENFFIVAARNRNLKINRAKIDHDRKIHKFEYKIGDLVLCDHPELKRGLSSGIARKYYGPFEIVVELKIDAGLETKTKVKTENDLNQNKENNSTNKKTRSRSTKNNKKDSSDEEFIPKNQTVNQPIKKTYQTRSQKKGFDYVIVPQTTSLNQNDYVAFVAFKDRSIHREVVREFQRVQPLNFGSRGMLFELNHKQTSIDLQIENRRLSSDKDERPEPKKQKSFSLDLSKTTIPTIFPKTSKEDDISNEPWTHPIPQNILEELNRKIQEFLEKTRSGKKQTDTKETALGNVVPLIEHKSVQTDANTTENFELKIKVISLELEIESKNDQIKRLLKEREEVKANFKNGYELFNRRGSIKKRSFLGVLFLRLRAPFLFLLKSKSKSTHNTTNNRERVLPRIEKTKSLWWRNSSSNQLTSLASSEIWLRQGLMSGSKSPHKERTMQLEMGSS
ncbi:hypothetical protein BpHYR1_021399 [Brachionus plicatilis]|uniref:Uncharacterized protein n=1 Tax=Brachionus plicatilis TaxID=10195 RepID=A0A3M7PYM5_BRAPC|nr:hypothetical protein BpHYR1_021399 [Brachionus plicatilis]